jgi:surfeit locus 1 family protein
MSGQRLHPIIVIVLIAFVALTSALGIWQLGRAEQRALDAERRAAAAVAPAVPWRGEVGEAVWQRRFVVAGTWLPGSTIFLDNRPYKARPGYWVVSVLQLHDGRSLPVIRGWMPKRWGVQPEILTPSGPQTLEVRLLPPRMHYVELAGGTVEGAVWQNLDPERLARTVGRPLMPALARLLQAEPGLVVDDVLPETGPARHIAYAVQWFLFALIAIGLFIRFHVFRPLKETPT